MNATTFSHQPLFPLGHTLSTPGALKALMTEGISSCDLLHRHQCGDWGDLCEEDRQENEYAIRHSCRILSAYTLPRTNVKLWIITEHDRSATTLLLPLEY